MTGATAGEAGYVVRFGRLERRGLLLGLSGPRLAWVAAAVVVFVTGEVAAGWTGVAVTFPVWATAAALGGVVVAGRPLLEWVPLSASWGWRRVRGATGYRHRLEAPVAGTLALPDRGRRLITTTDDGAALVWDRRAGTATIVARVHPAGFLLAESAVQAARVVAWGRVMAGWCRQGDVARVQVLHRVTPGGGVAVRRWWSEHATDASAWASQVVADAVADTVAHTDRHETLVAFAVRGARSRRLGVDVAQRAVPVLTQALHAADVEVAGWLTPAELRHVVRTVYDPDGARLDPPSPGRRDVDPRGVAGPMAVEESWDRLRTDTAWHAVAWVAEWPRTAARADLLAPLLAASGVHRSVSLTVEPVATGRALREVRRARVAQAADAAHRSRVGRLDDESTLAETDDVARRELDLVAGHGDVAFTGLVTVTATSGEALDGAYAAVETAAAQAMCELRRLSGQQVAAHTAAAIPLATGVLR